MKSPLRLGVVTDEFFDPKLGRLGGFGWAARSLARLFAEDPSLGVEVVFLASQLPAEGRTETSAHGARLILRRPTRLANMLAARRERFDLLLTIDYNLSHSVWLRSLPRTPCIVWIRDPRTPSDAARIQTLRIPGAPLETPQGLHCYDGRSMMRIVRESRWLGRKLLFATPELLLGAKLEETYGLEPWHLHLLPNIIPPGPPDIEKSPAPTVVYLGRTDPIKRPWIFIELARRFPAVEFLVLGQSHFHGPGSWTPSGLPPNVRLLGHTGEDEKRRMLSQAWVTVNTSIHEGLAVSLLESLACATPLVSCRNPGFVVSRYGVHTGAFDGDGLAGLDAFGNGLRALLNSPQRRLDLGAKGRQWVESVHSKARFVAKFQDLCRLAGVAR